jgi:hypothetical protein
MGREVEKGLGNGADLGGLAGAKPREGQWRRIVLLLCSELASPSMRTAAAPTGAVSGTRTAYRTTKHSNKMYMSAKGSAHRGVVRAGAYGVAATGAGYYGAGYGGWGAAGIVLSSQAQSVWAALVSVWASVWALHFATRPLTIRPAGTNFARVLALFLGQARSTGDWRSALAGPGNGGRLSIVSQRVLVTSVSPRQLSADGAAEAERKANGL